MPAGDPQGSDFKRMRKFYLPALMFSWSALRKGGDPININSKGSVGFMVAFPTKAALRKVYGRGAEIVEMFVPEEGPTR